MNTSEFALFDRIALALERIAAALEARAKVHRPKREREAGEPGEYSGRFLAFWTGYKCERRRNKPAAWAEWKRSGAEGAATLEALAAFKLTAQWRDGFMPEPARWLKSKPWLDEPTADTQRDPLWDKGGPS